MVHKDYANKLTNYLLSDVYIHEPEEKFLCKFQERNLTHSFLYSCSNVNSFEI